MELLSYDRLHILMEKCFMYCQVMQRESLFITYNVIPLDTKLYGLDAVMVTGAKVTIELFAAEVLFPLVAVSIGQYRIWTSFALTKHCMQQSCGGV